MTDPKSIAYYLRVSTAAQDFPAQRHALTEFARRKGWAAPSRKNLFSEKISGAKVKRRELDRMLQACREGKFDTVIAYRVDRVGRSVSHLLQIYEECEAKGIRLIGVADNVDTADDSLGARIFRKAMALIAEIGRDTIRENTRNGLAAARLRGKMPGRPRTNDAAISRAFKLKAEGKHSGAEIARKTGLSQSYLSQVFSGKRKIPGLTLVQPNSPK